MKNKNLFKLISEHRLAKARGTEGQLNYSFWYTIVSSHYLKSNKKGGCSGNLAEESGNAGAVILEGKSMKKWWLLQPKGTGEIHSGREEWSCKNTRYEKGYSIWENKVCLWLPSSVKVRAETSPSQGILLRGSVRMGFQESEKSRSFKIKGNLESPTGRYPPSPMMSGVRHMA